MHKPFSTFTLPASMTLRERWQHALRDPGFFAVALGLLMLFWFLV